ncbi:RICIN domain-containing protein, partial [Bacillus thuringiensis]|uniref:RICIN domain-containing protein n=1 Tax=Bacillus thuringiensis TaxID=1428 RepID=UPI002AB40B12
AIARNEGRIIIVNVHQTGRLNQTYINLFQEFGVVAIFGGHLHFTLGRMGSAGGIPVFLSGSASQRTYLILEQYPNELRIFSVRCNDWQGHRQHIHTIPTPPLHFHGHFQIITALNNSSVLDLNGPPISGPGDVTLWSNNGGNNQRWNFTYDQSEDAHVIRSVSNPSLVLAWNVPTSNRNVFATPFVPGRAEHYWIIEHFQNGYIFRNKRNTNLVLDVVASRTSNGTNIVVYESHPLNTTARNQTFFMRPV